MTMDWSKFDKQVDLDGIEEKVAKAAEQGDFPELPVGQYEVKVIEMELGQSKAKDPMLRITFEIVDGEYESQKVWFNGVMQPNSEWFHLQIHNNNEMLGSLVDDKVKFENFTQYAQEIEDIADEIITDEWEYILDKTKNKKDYDVLKIVEILE